MAPNLLSSNSGALFRFVSVSLFFLLNLISLLRLLFRGNAKLCVHSVAYAFVVIVINAYLSSWIPYLFSSFYHETAWPLLEVDTHCTIQHIIAIQLSTLLLVTLCFQKMFEAFSAKRAKLLSAIIIFTWIFPQLIHSIVSEIVSIKDNSNLYLMDSLPNQPALIDESKDLPISHGVLFCIHRLDSSVISNMAWHYVVLVIPLTSMFIICTGAKRFAKSTVPGKLSSANCRCSTDVIITVCLYTNFIWLLFLRPLLSLVALLRNDIVGDNGGNVGKDFTPGTNFNNSITFESLPLDLGSNLILLLMAVLLPFSRQMGLFSSTSNYANTDNCLQQSSKPDKLMIANNNDRFNNKFYGNYL